MTQGHPATKADLQSALTSALAAQREEIRAVVSADSKYIPNEISATTSKLRGFIRAGLAEVTAGYMEDLRRMETNLVAAFRSYDV